MAPRTAPTPTQAQHDEAVRRSKHVYYDSIASLPQQKVNAAMFSAAPPSQLGVNDAAEYGRQYNLLVEALNAPGGTSKYLGTDQASRARLALWRLWFLARDIAAGEEEEDEEEDDEEAKTDEDEEMDDDEAVVVDQGGVPGGKYSWTVDSHEIFRLYENGRCVKFGANSNS